MSNLPSDRGAEAANFLAECGFQPQFPIATSTALARARSCSFAHYLIDRLGIVPALSYSPALGRGSWYHARMALDARDLDPADASWKMLALLDVRKRELRETCSKLGITGDSLKEVLDREERDCKAASAWWEATLHIPFPYLNGGSITLHRFFYGGPLRVLASELTLLWRYPGHEKVPLVVTLDKLLFTEASGQPALWIHDAKTSADPPAIRRDGVIVGGRLLTCPLELQTRHYMRVVHELLPTLISAFNLPPSTRLGGMIHHALQKPTIDFGQNDRRFTLDTTPFKSGPRKGQPRNEKVYYGEPDYTLYIERVKRWYAGTEEYSHFAQKRLDEPPINISWTNASPDLSAPEDLEYNDHLLDFLCEGRRPSPVPSDYVRNSSYLAENTKYAPFYLCPPAQWPEIVNREGFVRAFRHPHITDSTPNGIVPSAAATEA